jgi:hypothetical protein
MSCRKIAYLTRAEARMSLQNVKRKGGSSVRSYHCKSCDMWHLTSTTKKQHKQIMRRENAVGLNKI